uniref:Uncharacterized protein n=1 Tax=Neogobius melanostomus TaxID=47308 RepID=A0A8C6U973_9GOBI
MTTPWWRRSREAGSRWSNRGILLFAELFISVIHTGDEWTLCHFSLRKAPPTSPHGDHIHRYYEACWLGLLPSHNWPAPHPGFLTHHTI